MLHWRMPFLHEDQLLVRDLVALQFGSDIIGYLLHVVVKPKDLRLNLHATSRILLQNMVLLEKMSSEFPMFNYILIRSHSLI